MPYTETATWDISDEEIREWKQTPGKRFAAYTAECIRDGKYDCGQELYPPDSLVYREITRETVDQAMRLLAERGMAKRSGDAWRAIAPGRMEPDLHRAITTLLARRDDLPPALADELDSWNSTLATGEVQVVGCGEQSAAEQQRTTAVA